MAGKLRNQLLAERMEGKAAGLEDAASVILGIVEKSTRVVGTNTLRKLAKALKESASHLRDRATDLTS